MIVLSNLRRRRVNVKECLVLIVYAAEIICTVLSCSEIFIFFELEVQ
jgi:hypothetical protein